MSTQGGFTELTAKALLERKNRANSALRMFRPTPKQEQFFRTMTMDQILEAAVTGRNRGGKSVAVAVWFASVVLDEPITMRNGDKLHMRPERWRGDELLCWLVGYDWKHIGETLYRLLFRPGLFKVISDKGVLRSYNPETDSHRKRERQPSPPLILESMVEEDSWSWESKKDRQLQSVKLKKDGTRLVFYASTGEVAAGNPVHVIWIDEKIQADSHYAEWLMRLVDYEGRLVWSSWPTLMPTGVFSSLLSRAREQESMKEPPTAVKFEFRLGDNPYTENATLKAAMGAMSEEEAAARGDGQIQEGRWLMYPRFSAYTHRVMSDEASGDDDLAKAIRQLGGIPGDWTRYFILDPGTANCGALKVAIPPPKFGYFVVPYQEYYFHYKDAGEVASIVAASSEGEIFEDFIIDNHAGRQTPMGFSGTIAENYEKEFKKAKLVCQRRGAHFRPGDDNPEMRQAKLSGLMNIGSNGKPRLRIHNCHVLVKQLSEYRRKPDPLGNPTDKPADYQKIDVAQCLEYAAAMDDLVYVPSKSKVTEQPSLVTMLKDLMKQHGITPQQLENSVHCGPGRAPAA